MGLADRLLSLPRINIIWPPYSFVVISPAILRHRHVRGAWKRSAAWLMLLSTWKAVKSFILIQSCSIVWNRSRPVAGNLISNSSILFPKVGLLVQLGSLTCNNNWSCNNGFAAQNKGVRF
jgi:hypothetical protein